MKRPASDLYALIGSMSGQERRYFRIYVSGYEGAGRQYLKLFDAISRQKKQDERELRRILRKESFVHRLFAVKAYLYDLILESLDTYHTGVSAGKKLRRSLRHIELLYEKGLYSQCRKLIERTERIAAKHESLTVLMELSDWKFRLARAGEFHRTFDDALDNIQKQRERLVEQISNYHRFSWLNTKLFTRAMRQGWFPRSPEEIKREYDPILSDALFMDAGKALSRQAVILYHNTLSAYFHLKGDHQKSYSHSKEAEMEFSQMPGLSDTNREDYISCLGNLVFTSLFLGKYEEAFRYIYQLKKMKLRSRALNAQVFTSAYLPELISYNMSGRFREGLHMIPEIQEKLEELGPLIHPREILYLKYNVACILFKAGEFKRASSWLFSIQNEAAIAYLPDLQTKVRILNLMVQTELGETDYLPYLLRSTYRFLLKQQRLNLFEKKVLDFIRDLPGLDAAQISPAFVRLRDEVTKLSEDPFEKKAMDALGFRTWLEKRTAV